MNGERRFEGKVALVTGGAQGIGKAIAMRLGCEGAQVAIADIDGPALEGTLRDMHGEGSDARGILCNVRKQEDVARTVREVLEWRGRIDIMMYVAGVAGSVPFLELTEEHWDRTIDINLRGGFLFARAVAPHMVKQGGGKLVFMGSTNCWDAEAELAQYNASKAGLFLLAKTLARELGRYGINSNAVGPGFIRTRLTEPLIADEQFMKKYRPPDGVIPLGRFGEPEDVAGPALFLASKDADFVNGVLLFVDGGQLA